MDNTFVEVGVYIHTDFFGLNHLNSQYTQDKYEKQVKSSTHS